MKQVFIKVQSSIGQSWADCIEGINTYSTGPANNPVEVLLNQADYTQKANVYTQVANLIKLLPDQSGGFKVSTPIPKGELDTKSIDMSTAFSCLTTQNGSYEVVYYGYAFDPNNDRVKDIDVIQNSMFFARDPSTKRFVNAVTEEELTEENSLMVAVWFALYRIKATQMYYMVINPNLISVTESLDGKFEDVAYYHLNTRDGTFRTKVFAPAIDGGTLIGNNIIVTNQDSVTIDTFGLSLLHYESRKVSAENIPAKIEMKVNSSFEYSREGSVLTIDTSNKNIGTLSYQWITGSYLDNSLTGNESLKYDFVIIKE